MDKEKQLFFMQQAIKQAYTALRKNEVPVGAIIVDSQGIILSKTHNKMEQTKCQTAHAELLAIQKACKKRGDWRLDDCWLYVTLEPCLMCHGLIQLSRLKGVFFAVHSHLFGFSRQCIISLNLSPNDREKSIYYHERSNEQECVDMLKTFFKKARNNVKDPI